MMPTTLVCIRHGQTAWNAAGKIQGHLDSSLTPQGRIQLETLGQRLKEHHHLPWSCIVASDLGRVRESAEALGIVTESHPPIEWRKDLRERHLGTFQGLTSQEIAEKYPDDYARWRATDPDFAPSGAETLRQFSQRIWHTTQTVVNQHREGNILLIAHGGVLGVLFRHIIGIDMSAPRRFSLDNATYNEIRIDEHDTWSIKVWGE